MNTRANIMYFIEHFVETASKDRHTETYVRMMQRDIIRVVDAVCPEDGSGAANVKVVRTVWSLSPFTTQPLPRHSLCTWQVLQNLNSKGFLLNETLAELEECLKERDTTHAEVGLSSPIKGDNSAGDRQGANGSGSGSAAAPIVETDPRAGNNGAGTTRLEKRQIEQRIEEDRERHKKRRENMWVVPRSRSEERRKFFDETSDLNEDDWRQEREERERFMAQIENAKCPHMRASRSEALKDPANGTAQDRMDVDKLPPAEGDKQEDKQD